MLHLSCRMPLPSVSLLHVAANSLSLHVRTHTGIYSDSRMPSVRPALVKEVRTGGTYIYMTTRKITWLRCPSSKRRCSELKCIAPGAMCITVATFGKHPRKSAESRRALRAQRNRNIGLSCTANACMVHFRCAEASCCILEYMVGCVWCTNLLPSQINDPDCVNSKRTSFMLSRVTDPPTNRNKNGPLFFCRGARPREVRHPPGVLTLTEKQKEVRSYEQPRIVTFSQPRVQKKSIPTNNTQGQDKTKERTASITRVHKRWVRNGTHTL